MHVGWSLLTIIKNARRERERARTMALKVSSQQHSASPPRLPILTKKSERSYWGYLASTLSSSWVHQKASEENSQLDLVQMMRTHSFFKSKVIVTAILLLILCWGSATEFADKTGRSIAPHPTPFKFSGRVITFRVGAPPPPSSTIR